MLGPSLTEVMTAWRLVPWVTVPLAGAVWLYLTGVRRLGRGRRRPAWPRRRTGAFILGATGVFVALQSPIDAYADVLLWVHMVQHLLLAMVAAPLVLLGAPVTLALRAGGPGRRRALSRTARGAAARTLSHPVAGWLAFAAVLVGTHFTPLYQAALEDPWLHGAEHALYLAGALLFWWPVVGVDPSSHHLSHPVRLLYLLLAGPVNTVTALVISSAGTVLYPHYRSVPRAWGPSPLLDQGIAGALMWIGGDLIVLTAAVLVLAAWARREGAFEDRSGAPPVVGAGMRRSHSQGRP